MTTLDRIRAIAKAHYRVVPQAVTPETMLADFDGDNLDRIGFVCEVEREFGIELPDIALDECRTIADLIDLLDGDDLREEQSAHGQFGVGA